MGLSTPSPNPFHLFRSPGIYNESPLEMRLSDSWADWWDGSDRGLPPHQPTSDRSGDDSPVGAHCPSPSVLCPVSFVHHTVIQVGCPLASVHCPMCLVRCPSYCAHRTVLYAVAIGRGLLCGIQDPISTARRCASATFGPIGGTARIVGCHLICLPQTARVMTVRSVLTVPCPVSYVQCPLSTTP
jgi:hypothetical protein